KDDDDTAAAAVSRAREGDGPQVAMQMKLLQLGRPLYEHWTVHSVPILPDAYSALSFASELYSSMESGSSTDGPLVWAAHLSSRAYTINVGHPTSIDGGSPAGARSELAGYMGRTLRAQIDAVITTSECPPEAMAWLDTAFRDSTLDLEWLPIVTSIYVTRCASVSSRYDGLVTELPRAGDELEARLASRPHLGRQSIDVFWMSMYQSCMIKAYHVAHLLANYLAHYTGGGCSDDDDDDDDDDDTASAASAAEIQAHSVAYLERVEDGSARILSSATRKLAHLRGQTVRSPSTLLEAPRLVWPLTAVYTIPSTPEAHEDTAWELLSLTGKELGVRQAIMVHAGAFNGMVPEKANAPLIVG
ncbi:Fungal Zn(2)-Cys(6) binuclear cluster domain, partial [Geosmithia morbida]